jgi:hypothetical protein
MPIQQPAMNAPMPATAISLPLLDAVAIACTSPPRAAPHTVLWTDHRPRAALAGAWSDDHAP